MHRIAWKELIIFTHP